MHNHTYHTLNETNQPNKHPITTMWAEHRGLQRIWFKLDALVQARGVPSLKLQPSLRRYHDRGPGRFFACSLRRAFLAWARPPLAQRWGYSPGLRMQQHTMASTRSHLGERLSLDQDSASLKTIALRLSESSRVTLACFCMSRLGESVSLGRE